MITVFDTLNQMYQAYTDPDVLDESREISDAIVELEIGLSKAGIIVLVGAIVGVPEGAPGIIVFASFGLAATVALYIGEEELRRQGLIDRYKDWHYENIRP